MSSRRAAPTIAVVAVHGATDARRGDAARAVADLLLRRRGAAGGRYSSFTERALRIPTEPARVNPRSAPNVPPALKRSLVAEQHPFLRTQLTYGGAAARDREEDSPDHQLMRAQLADYRSAGDAYETIRLEGERVGPSADDDVQARLHVYELHWADVARWRAGLPRVLGELYQLLLHIAHLGRTALDHARLEHATSRLWRTYGVTHSWAVRLLTIAVPALFLAMLTAACAVAAVALAGPGTVREWTALAGVLAAGAGATYVAFRAYEPLRPGALPAGVAAFGVVAVLLAAARARASTHDELVARALNVVDLAAAGMMGVWVLIAALGAAGSVLGLSVIVRASGDARSRAWRAARTAALTLVIATVLLTAFTSVISSAVYAGFDSLLPRRPLDAVISGLSVGAAGRAVAGHLLDVFASVGVPVLLAGGAVAVAASVVVLAPVFARELRSRRREASLEQRADRPDPVRGAPVDTDARWAAWEQFRGEGNESERAGASVSRALRFIGAIGLALYVTAFVIVPAVVAVQLIASSAVFEPLPSSASAVILVAGGGLVAATLALVTCGGRLQRLAPGFRPAVQMVLDVDHYLRTHPRNRTPRARIAERYVSLLRYLCRWRDEHSRPYDAIVLVAHSQGAAITSDLLTFIQREEDPELEPLRRPLANGVPDASGRRLFMLTMGNPLRQLYAELFPHLYGWVRGERGDGVARPLPAVPRESWMLVPRLEAGHRVHPPQFPDRAPPDPYALGVTRWVNAYRSGDYVGRALWRGADDCDWIHRAAPADAATRFATDAPPVTYVSEDAQRSRRELCIGNGAHTSYWDATAKAIAIELDLLVTDAMKLATRVGKDTGAPAEG